MTIKECIDLVDNVKPNQYGIEDKVEWLSYLDGTIINDVLKTHEGYDGRYDDFMGYSYDRLSEPLVVPSPYDRLYTAYLKMKIDEENGETARYNNSASLFNAYLLDYKKYYNKTHMPLHNLRVKKTDPTNTTQSGISGTQLENMRRELLSQLQTLISNSLSSDKIYDAVNEYLAIHRDEFKGKDGADGITPHIGDNGNWWIGTTDTGVSATVKQETGAGFEVDDTLSVSGAAADAAVVGQKFSQLSGEIVDLKENGTGETITAECIDYDVTVKTISHRGYNTEAPENTIPAYVLARQKGYKYAECDVSFTSDGVAVLLHDSTIDRTSDGTGSISALTYEEVSQYDFGSWFSSDFIGTKIPTFKEFIVLCRNIGLYPYIELKNNGGYTQETVNGLVEIVKATGMLKKVTWISFSSTFLGYVKNADSAARLGFLCDTVSDESTATAINSIQNLQNEENEVFADSSMHYLSDEKIQQFIDANIPLEVYYIATDETKISEKVLNANEYISGFTLDKGIAGKILHENYMNYIPSEPDTPDNPEVTLSSISATYTGGNVTVGTSVNDLTGITVKATYSDGSTANVSEYALSGTITEGENTVTVTYQGKTTTFMVTGVAESGGEEPDIPDEPTTGSLIRNWDFTSSLIDSIGNNEARKSSDGVVQNENGITISGQYQQLGMYDVVGANKRIEIDVHSMSADFTGIHGRFLMFDSNGHTSIHSNGFIYRSTGSWDFYNGSWKGTTVEVNANAFTGKTIVIEIGAECIPKVYCDNVLIAESPTAIDSTITNLFIGDSAKAYSTVTISGVRVYNIS